MIEPCVVQAIERRMSYEYPLHISNGNSHQESLFMNPVIIQADNSVTKADNSHKFQTTRENLNESITVPSKQNFIFQNMFAMANMYNDLKFHNTDIIKTGFEILQRCALKNYFDIKVSKTSENEILIYRKKRNEFYNLLIDEDGDVSFMYVGVKIGSEKVQYFSKEKGLDFDKITSLI